MKWIIKDKNYQPTDRYLYITKDCKWLMVRYKGAKPISVDEYCQMLVRGMPDIFERMVEENERKGEQ